MAVITGTPYAEAVLEAAAAAFKGRPGLRGNS